MRSQISAAREISYSTTAKTLRGRMFIRSVENATGRMRVMRQVRGYDKAMSQGDLFWNVVPDLCGLKLDVVSGSLDNIPKTGPVVLLSNHPYGILDGLMLGQILSKTRDDFHQRSRLSRIAKNFRPLYGRNCASQRHCRLRKLT